MQDRGENQAKPLLGPKEGFLKNLGKERYR